MSELKKIAFELAVNNLSFGQVSTLILRELFEREKQDGKAYEISLFPIGGSLDLKSQTPNPEFVEWLKSKIQYGLEKHDRKTPVFRLWHFNGSLSSYSKEQSLLVFHELDEPTPAEINCAINNKTYFSSKYSQEVFKSVGVDTGYIPLGFDSYNFKTINKKYHNDDRIVFNICGKFEKRKHSAKIIQSWIKRFGNKPQYALQCAIYNPFLKDEQNQQVVNHILQGQPKPFNVNFYPMLEQNALYNEFLNSADIILAMSGCEGFGLPEFQSIAMGKHAVMLNAHVYKDWATSDMVTFVNSNGKEPAYDGMFFHQGQAFNQGNIFTWNEDDFVVGCELVINKVKNNRVNTAGLKLQQDFSKEKFVDAVLATFN